jgi:UrcA family protein
MAIALGGGLATVPVSAEASREANPSVVVHFADLDISGPAGATVLYGRIQSAASGVCAAYNSYGLSSLIAERKCVRLAVAEAVARLNLSALTAVYASKTHKPQTSSFVHLQ